jgi:nitrite reductase/ring-hydroxylating ferredoxin subunit
MTEFVRLCPAAKLDHAPIAVGRVGVRQVAVVRLGDRLHAFKNTCPHAGSPLSNGKLCAGTIQCPRHQWVFDIASGACAEHPLYALSLYDARERDGWIEVREQNPEIW